MLLSGQVLRRLALGCIGAGAIASAMLFGGTAVGWTQPPEPAPAPPAPGCTAADLAQVSGGVATATSEYLFNHPDVNNFFTGLRGTPNDQVSQAIRSYLDANPQARSDLMGIRQPLTDLRTRCEAPPRL